MKIKYRRFDDNDYTEVDVKMYIPRTDTKIIFQTYDNECHVIEDVCEVYIEKYEISKRNV